MYDAGVRLWSLTDHDTIDGLDRAQQASDELGMTLVQGVELSCRYLQGQVHIVGLGPQLSSVEFAPLLQQLARARVLRAEQIAQRLQAKGLPDLLADAQALAGLGQIGRPHFAKAMVDRHLVRDTGKAFQLWLGAGKAGDVRAHWPSMDEVLPLMRGCNLVPVLAHPHRLGLTLTKARQLLRRFAALGGKAVELACAGIDPQWQINLEREALSLGLSYSRASDFHGTSPWVKPGQAQDWSARIPAVWQVEHI